MNFMRYSFSNPRNRKTSKPQTRNTPKLQNRKPATSVNAKHLQTINDTDNSSAALSLMTSISLATHSSNDYRKSWIEHLVYLKAVS